MNANELIDRLDRIQRHLVREPTLKYSQVIQDVGGLIEDVRFDATLAAAKRKADANSGG